MSGNLLSLNTPSSLAKKVRNFPDDIYDFNPGDNLTTLMTTLLGGAGTGQLSALQVMARLGQQYLEYSNLDAVMGQLLSLSRNSDEIYSFSNNPFTDQLDYVQWEEILGKDASYRERLLQAAEAYQLGSSVWGVVKLAEAVTGIEFRVVESWRTSGKGRFNDGSSNNTEIVLIPVLDSLNNSGRFTWNQSKANSLVQALSKLVPVNYVVSIGTPVQLYTRVTPNNPYPNAIVQTSSTSNGVTTLTSSGSYSEYFYLNKTSNAGNLINPNTTSNPTTTWLQNNSTNLAPTFAHLQTQESLIDLTGSIVSTTVSDSSANPQNSIALPSVSITSTVYGG